MLKYVGVVSAVVFCAACGLDGAGDAALDPDDLSSDLPRLAANGVGPDKIASGDLNALQLTAANLDALAANDPPNLALQYAVYCALPSGSVVTATVNGTTYSYPGALGMAPGWTSADLAATDAAWISACVNALVNRTSLTVTVSLRGHAALATTPSEATTYRREEGAFWGNVFTSLGPVTLDACMGLDQARGETGALIDRDCAEPDAARPGFNQCGGRYFGTCDVACASGTAPFAGCAGTAQVVTAFVK